LLRWFDEVRTPIRRFIDDPLMLTMAPFGRIVAGTMWETSS